jgi:hypothetical protein
MEAPIICFWPTTYSLVSRSDGAKKEKRERTSSYFTGGRSKRRDKTTVNKDEMSDYILVIEPAHFGCLLKIIK